MFTIQHSSFLRRILLVDALTSVAAGLPMALGADFLSPLLGLPPMLLREAGIILLPFAALLAWIATRTELPRRGVWAVIACNAIWVLGSIVLLLSGWVNPTVFGQVFIVAQALVAAVWADLEYAALRKSSASLAYQ